MKDDHQFYDPDGPRRRQPILKKRKGRAFLRFLIGELFLAVLCSVVYLVVVQGDIISPPASTPRPQLAAATDSAQPAITPAPAGTARAGQVTPGKSPAASAKAQPEATQAPTPTPIPTPTPTPAPTPIAEELFAPMIAYQAGEPAQTEPVAPDVPDAMGISIKQGLREFQAFEAAGQRALTVSGYAFLPGKDAARSAVYLVILDAVSGEPMAMYPARNASDAAWLQFDDLGSANLDQAFFSAYLDIASLPDGMYLLHVLVVNEDFAEMAAISDRIRDFTVSGGAVAMAGG